MDALKIDSITLMSAKGAAGSNKALAKAALSLDDAKKVGSKATLDQAAKGFEALFVQTMLKEMHNAKLENGLFDTEGEKPFQSMLDQAYADLATKQNRFGIADAIKRTFQKSVDASGYEKTP
jgi:Rod binding domain-containing protein